METTEQKKQNNLLEIRGILRTLADNQGQSICKEDRLMELIKFLKDLKE